MPRSRLGYHITYILWTFVWYLKLSGHNLGWLQIDTCWDHVLCLHGLLCTFLSKTKWECLTIKMRYQQEYIADLRENST